jgi:hypothetical protein
MHRQFTAFALLLIISFSGLSGEKLGNLTIEVGKPLAFNQGVFYDYGDNGQVQVFVYQDRFTVVFLDASKRVYIPKGIDLITVMSQNIYGNDQFYPYHLQPSPGGTYFTNQRHVYRPHEYNIDVYLRKMLSKNPRYRMRRFDERYIKIPLGEALLSQVVRPVKPAN